MKLTFDVAYEDYEDEQNWIPRLNFLQKEFDKLEIDFFKKCENDTLLDTMEWVEELMRYYTVKRNYALLEKVMRMQGALLEIGKSRNIQEIGFQYECMIFARVNALLYRMEDRNRESMNYYRQAIEIGENITASLRNHHDLRDEQKFYIGWACLECLKEAGEVFDLLLASTESLDCCYRVLNLLDWLENYMSDSFGLLDKTAELYNTYGGILFVNGDVKTGQQCFLKSIHLFEQLDEKYDSDFYYARSLWVKGLYGLQLFFTFQDTSMIQACEQEINSHRANHLITERDKAIILAASGIIQAQKGIARQEINLHQAIELTDASCKKMKEAIDLLEKDQAGHNDYYQSVITAIIIRIFNCYVGTLDSLGVLLYNIEQFDQAKNTFKNVIELLDNSSDYKMSDAGAIMIRAESLNYLTLISVNEEDADAAEFYGEQAISMAQNAANYHNNPVIYSIIIVCGSLLAELYLMQKNREKALKYADIGLQACDILERTSPESPQLSLRRTLDKFKRKASRKFF